MLILKQKIVIGKDWNRRDHTRFKFPSCFEKLAIPSHNANFKEIINLLHSIIPSFVRDAETKHSDSLEFIPDHDEVFQTFHCIVKSHEKEDETIENLQKKLNEEW